MAGGPGPDRPGPGHGSTSSRVVAVKESPGPGHSRPVPARMSGPLNFKSGRRRRA